ncbi:MAG TPA: energy transducer TonB [Gemmatimonadales bacterium]|nr:energy transducer TonB [Gemmatimonadales bacterium]
MNRTARAALRMPTAAAIVAAALAGLACEERSVGTVALGEHRPPAESPADQPPVAINPVTPMVYPPALLEQGIEGRVLLRLFVDAQGNLVPDSIRLAESSGYPALDSAALSGARELRFSPALRNGRAIAAPFLQPIHFRHPRSKSDP